MNDDKIFIQDFDKDNKKGLIIVDDDSDIIIEQNGSFLAERAQDVHEPERGPDGVAVGILMGCDDDPLSARQDGCCFTQCHYHVNVLLS